jgi:hypothetical protein
MPNTQPYRNDDRETDDEWLTDELFPMRRWRWHGWMEDD